MAVQGIITEGFTRKERFKLWATVNLIALIQIFVRLTSRSEIVYADGVEPLRANSNYILGIWHAAVLYAPTFNRRRDVTAMVSASRDGELTARMLAKYGVWSVRGSTSRGGKGALKTLIKVVRGGVPGALIPDGPRGPAFKAQGGIVALAQVTGKPIVPFHYECTRQWIMEKAWDKHRMPKPFTRFVVSYGAPIEVPRRMSETEFNAMVVQVEEKMNANVEFCRARAAELRGKAEAADLGAAPAK